MRMSATTTGTSREMNISISSGRSEDGVFFPKRPPRHAVPGASAEAHPAGSRGKSRSDFDVSQHLGTFRKNLSPVLRNEHISPGFRRAHEVPLRERIFRNRFERTADGDEEREGSLSAGRHHIR